MLGVIGWLVFGLIVGTVAKLLTPGKDPGGAFATVALGIAGALCAGFMGEVLGWYQPGEPAGFLTATLGAILLLFVYKKAVTKV